MYYQLIQQLRAAAAETATNLAILISVIDDETLHLRPPTTPGYGELLEKIEILRSTPRLGHGLEREEIPALAGTNRPART